MSRIIRTLTLICCCFTIAWTQEPPDLQRDIAARYLDWSQHNTVLFEAVRRLTPCSPRISTLIQQARENSSALAKVTQQYLDQHSAQLRQQLAANSHLASEFNVSLEELQPFEQLSSQYQQRTEVRLRRTGTAPEATTASNAAAKLREFRDGLSQTESLLRQVAEGAAQEQKLWTAYYDAVEAATRRQCAEAQPAGARPAPAAPAKKR
jgi:hypothetical protein